MIVFHPIAYVYIFLREDGLRKVGLAIDVRQRRTNLTMDTGIHHEIDACWQSDERTIIGVERTVHNKLKKLRFRGHSSIELYDLPFQRICDEVEAAFIGTGVQPTKKWKPCEYTDHEVMAAISKYGIYGALRHLNMCKKQLDRHRIT